MNREDLKALLPVMEAYANGATVQFRHLVGDVWHDHFNPDFSASPHCYRIKPEPVEVFINFYEEGGIGAAFETYEKAVSARGHIAGVTKRFKEVIE